MRIHNFSYNNSSNKLKQVQYYNSGSTLVANTISNNLTDMIILENKNNVQKLTFKAQDFQKIEYMNFKTKGTFLMIKELFEQKAKVLSEDMIKFKEYLEKNFGKYNIELSMPILATNSEVYGCNFQLLRVPVEKIARYFMVITTDKQSNKIELKDEQLIAKFDPNEKGMTLNEYVLAGLESHFSKIQTQEKFDEMESDYRLRDSKVSKHFDNELAKVQSKIASLKEQVDNNTGDIQNLKKDINGINDKINALRKELIRKIDLLSESINEMDDVNSYELKMPPIYIWDKGSLKQVGGISERIDYGAIGTMPPSEEFFEWLIS